MHSQTEPVSPFLADSGTELLVPLSTGPQTVSAVCESGAQEFAQLCKEIRSEFGCSDCYKGEDTPEDEYVGKLLNIKVDKFSAVCAQTHLAEKKIVSLLLLTSTVLVL